MRIPRQAFWASLRSRHAYGHVTRGILCGNLQGDCAGNSFCYFLPGRPAGQSVLSSAGRPARRVYEPRPAGRPDSVCVLAGRPARSLPGCFCIGFVFGWPAGRPAGCLVGWLGGWLSLLDVFVFG